jgi:hypothetical protein
VVVNVTLTVKAPPPTLTASPAPLSFTYKRGDAPPAAKPLKLSTNGASLTSGGSWLSVAPRSGVVFPAFPATMNVSLYQAALPHVN